MNENNGFGAIRSMDYVILLCDDLETMQCFYTDLFGWRIEEEVPNRAVEYRVGTLFLMLRPRGRPYDGPRIPGESASIQLSFRVPPADVDAAYETLLDKGINVIEPPTNQDWTHRTLFFADPENNIIEIYTDIHPRDTASIPSTIHQIAKR